MCRKIPKDKKLKILENIREVVVLIILGEVEDKVSPTVKYVREVIRLTKFIGEPGYKWPESHSQRSRRRWYRRRVSWIPLQRQYRAIISGVCLVAASSKNNGEHQSLLSSESLARLEVFEYQVAHERKICDVTTPMLAQSAAQKRSTRQVKPTELRSYSHNTLVEGFGEPRRIWLRGQEMLPILV